MCDAAAGAQCARDAAARVNLIEPGTRGDKDRHGDEYEVAHADVPEFAQSRGDLPGRAADDSHVDHLGRYRGDRVEESLPVIPLGVDVDEAAEVRTERVFCS